MAVFEPATVPYVAQNQTTVDGRAKIFANQKKLGVILLVGAKLTPWPDGLPKWDMLSPEAKKLNRFFRAIGC